MRNGYEEGKFKEGIVMKANELMIGDWVECTYWTPSKQLKVAEIRRIMDDETKIGLYSDGLILIFRQSEVKPIPLTPEILEKNDIKWFSTEPSGKKTYCCNNPIIHCDYFPNSGWLVSVGACGSIKVRFVEISKVQHVHELQHALRLCGIEKEIIL